MDQTALLKLLTGREPEAIARTLAMMAYNPAIGRVLEEGGVDRFEDLMVETVPRFYGEVSRERFEALHGETCSGIIESFKKHGSLAPQVVPDLKRNERKCKVPEPSHPGAPETHGPRGQCDVTDR
jgi:hypothetical protein